MTGNRRNKHTIPHTKNRIYKKYISCLPSEITNDNISREGGEISGEA